MKNLTPEQLRCFAVPYVYKAVEIAKRSFPLASRTSRTRWRNYFAGKFFGVEDFVTLQAYVEAQRPIVFCYEERVRGPFAHRTPEGQTVSYQDVLNFLGPFCENQEVQFKLLDFLDAMGEKHLRVFPARRAAYRIECDIIGQLYIRVFDLPAYAEVSSQGSQPVGDINLTVKENIIRQFRELPFN